MGARERGREGERERERGRERQREIESERGKEGGRGRKGEGEYASQVVASFTQYAQSWESSWGGLRS